MGLLARLRGTTESAPQSHIERHISASVLAGYATDIFHDAVRHLHDAADQQDDIVRELEDEIDKLVSLQGDALAEADEARTRARRIADLVA